MMYQIYKVLGDTSKCWDDRAIKMIAESTVTLNELAEICGIHAGDGTLYKANNSGYVIGIRKCGKIVKELFNVRFGFPIGKKSTSVTIPKFIMRSNSPEIWINYLRGVFDTDGCIYLNKRTGRQRKYEQPIIQFTSRSFQHLLQLKQLLNNLKFNVWIEENNSKVKMGGWSTSARFLKLIKPKNERHWKRIKILMPRLFNMLRSHNLVVRQIRKKDAYAC